MNQQIDTDGQLHDLAPAHERLRLFEPAPTQLAGQMCMDTTNGREAMSTESPTDVHGEPVPATIAAADKDASPRRYASAVVVTVAAGSSSEALELIEQRLHGDGITVEYARGAVACPAGHDSSSTDWQVPILEWNGQPVK